MLNKDELRSIFDYMKRTLPVELTTEDEKLYNKIKLINENLDLQEEYLEKAKKVQEEIQKLS